VAWKRLEIWVDANDLAALKAAAVRINAEDSQIKKVSVAAIVRRLIHEWLSFEKENQ
jgi:hypothetical protein